MKAIERRLLHLEDQAGLRGGLVVEISKPTDRAISGYQVGPHGERHEVRRALGEADEELRQRAIATSRNLFRGSHVVLIAL